MQVDLTRSRHAPSDASDESRPSLAPRSASPTSPRANPRDLALAQDERHGETDAALDWGQKQVIFGLPEEATTGIALRSLTTSASGAHNTVLENHPQALTSRWAAWISLHSACTSMHRNS